MQVVFSEAWWIGKKEDNPDECRLPLPQSVIEAGRKAQGNIFENDIPHSLSTPLHCIVKDFITDLNVPQRPIKQMKAREHKPLQMAALLWCVQSMSA